MRVLRRFQNFISKKCFSYFKTIQTTIQLMYIKQSIILSVSFKQKVLNIKHTIRNKQLKMKKKIKAC